MAMTTVGSLANGIAHHLNNPLSGIDMCADILLKKIEEVKEATLYGELKYSLTRIKEASRRCETAMEGLHSVSRISAPDRLPISTNKLMEHVLREAYIPLERAGIQLAREPVPTDIRIFGSHSQLRMAFANVISIAADAMSNGGVLTFKTMHLYGEGKVEVTISDTGPEIKESDLPHLFDPYFILKIRPAGRCTGLELALAQFTFQLHGGTIEADSGVGKGTTFKVKLPVYNETLQPKRESYLGDRGQGLGVSGSRRL